MTPFLCGFLLIKEGFIAWLRLHPTSWTQPYLVTLEERYYYREDARGEAGLVRVSGIPLHVWNPHTFHCITASLGSLKKVDKETVEGDCLLFARLLVEVEDVCNIPEAIVAGIGGVKYKIYIVAESAIPTVPSLSELDWSWAVVAAYWTLCLQKQGASLAGAPEGLSECRG